MKLKAQSLIEFAIILISVTAVAVIALQIINIKINSSGKSIDTIDDVTNIEQSSEEENCTKLGLYWDKQNGVCEAK